MALAVMSQAPPMISPAAANAINPRRFMVSPSVREYLRPMNSKWRAIPPLLASLDHTAGLPAYGGLKFSAAAENYQTFTRYSNPSLRLRKGKRLAGRGRHAKHVEDHRYQHVVAEDADELDGRSFAENGTYAREGLIADAPRLVELLDEIIDRALVLRGRFRDAPLVQVADRLGFDARALGLGHVGEPLVLRAPQLCRGQDGEFGEPRRHRRLEAAMAAELLREFPEGRSMQEHRERSADGGAAAARAGADRVEQRALGGRKLVFGENGDAGRRDFLGGLFGRLLGRHGASSFRFRSRCGARGYLNSSDLMMIGTTLVSSMTLPMST